MIERAGDLQPLWNTCRLRSLWDMLNFYASNFVELSKEIGRITEDLRRVDPNSQLDFGNKNNNIEVFKRQSNTFTLLGLPMCKAVTDRIVTAISGESITNREFSLLMSDLFSRMVDECNLSHFLSFSVDEWSWIFPEKPLFGEKVEKVLPNISEDIQEAASCVGFHRPTAAVFHLMRIMEIGVQKFGAKLGVEFVEEKVWQAILDHINKEVKKLGKSGKDYAEIAAHLYHVKLAWRNETMHPKATYTDEEAASIFRSVRIFMQTLVDIL